MLFAYRLENGRLTRMEPDADLSAAIWIDLYRPQPEQAGRVAALGYEIPSLAEMEEIEISNRLYRVGKTEYMTVVLPGQTPEKGHIAAPVTFVLSETQLITIRHHAPRPFETFPDRADKSGTGCTTPARLFLGLTEEIIGRLADLLEATGRSLDGVTRHLFGGDATRDANLLQQALEVVGREGELLGRIRLALLTMERALVHYGQAVKTDKSNESIRAQEKARFRDIQALEVHADFLSARLANVTDTTLGMVNLAQNNTVRILSVVSALFLPPTLIASAYGMNFHDMPELGWDWGYPMALALMVLSALATYVFLKWKKWL